MKKKVLIIGAYGYLGSALYEHLKNMHDVQGIDLRYARDDRMFIDYRNLGRPIIAPFQWIVFLAGHSSVAACDKDKKEAFENNVAGLVDLLKRLEPQQQFIFASSASVYGNTYSHVASETTLLEPPLAAYDWHKQMGETLLTLFHNSYALRLGTVCGPSPRIRRDLVLNRMVEMAARGQPIERNRQNVWRPLLGINDFCRAVESIISKRPDPGTYNLCSLNTLIHHLSEKVAKRFDVKITETDQRSPYDMRMSTQKIKEAIGFQPTDTIDSLIEELAACFTK